MPPTLRAKHIATVISLINEARPIDEATAPAALKAAIEGAAQALDTNTRRVHQNMVYAMHYRGRGAQNRVATDLIDPAAPAFRVAAQKHLTAADAAHVLAALDGTTAKPIPYTVVDLDEPIVRRGTDNNDMEFEEPLAQSDCADVTAVSPTATALWLDEQLAAGLVGKLTSLTHKRYPIEDIDDVRGEAHLRIAHWAANGSFDDHLKIGHPPTLSRMSAWVGNRVKSSLGRRGQDALWRHMRGSRTEIEFRRESVHPDSVKPTQTFTVGLEGGDEGSPKSVQQVIIDPASLEDPIIVAEPVVSPETALRMIIRASRPNAAERYIKVLDAMVADASRSDIAELDGCSVSRAGKMTARNRAALKSAPMVFTVSDARKILRYIVEEPCVTYGELIEDLRMGGEEVDRALQLLMLNEIAYVTETAGRSFMATDIGLAAATGERPDGLVGRLMI